MSALEIGVVYAIGAWGCFCALLLIWMLIAWERSERRAERRGRRKR